MRSPFAPADPDGDEPTTILMATGASAKEAASLGRLADLMTAAWQHGGRPTVEDVLAAHPGLCRDREAVLALVCEEICLRREHRLDIDADAWRRRLPEWRDEIAALLECQQLLEPEATAAAVNPLGGLRDFELIEEIGHGGQGRVFLATQPLLADRPIVVKVTPCGGREHLALARLQHTHIVPLYWTQDQPQDNLRILCMPFLGTVTLSRVLDRLGPVPLAQRTGQHILKILDEGPLRALGEKEARGPARTLLARVNCAQAMVWMGACLAEALQYAHERALLHLDIKPTNVLWCSDGQPMILDFHLAQPPLQPNGHAPKNLGGTLGHMAPEHEAALRAVSHGQPIARGVDARADVYALGVLLHHALGGARDLRGPLPRLEQVNPQVSPGLADIIRKCLAKDPAHRYQDTESLATDLRRHLSDLPLRGVRNRSLGERWRKWRRRKPHALLSLALATLVAATFGLILAGVHWQRRERAGFLAQAEKTLAGARSHLRDRKFDLALIALENGRALVPPDAPALAAAFAQEQRLALRQRALQLLHDGVDGLRSAVVAEALLPGQIAMLEAQCRALWQHHGLILPASQPLDDRTRHDIVDLVLIWSELRLRQTQAPDLPAVRAEIIAVLDKVELHCGPSPMLDEQRWIQRQALNNDSAAAADAPRLEAPASLTPWAHLARARSLLLRSEQLTAAATCFCGQASAASLGQRVVQACLATDRLPLAQAAWHCERALEEEPDQFWAHFYVGVSAFRQGDFAQALAAFRVCQALQPRHAVVAHNCALAAERLGRYAQAAAEYTRALELDPHFTAAALGRAHAHGQLGNDAAARADLDLAARLGAERRRVK